MDGQFARRFMALPRIRDEYYDADSKTGMVAHMLVVLSMVLLLSFQPVSDLTGLTVGEFLIVVALHYGLLIPYLFVKDLYRRSWYYIVDGPLCLSLCCLVVFFTGDPASFLWVFFLLFAGVMANAAGLNLWLMLAISIAPFATGLALWLNGSLAEGPVPWIRLAVIVVLALSFYGFAGSMTDKYVALLEAKTTIEKGLEVERERSRLARELHDGVSSLFASIATCSEAGLEAWAGGDRDRGREMLKRVGESSRRGLWELRSILSAMDPESGSFDYLVSQVRRGSSDLLDPGGLTVSVLDQTKGEIPTLPPHLVLAILRITQEACHNILEHSEASGATIRFERTGGGLALDVSDNGRGFDVQSVSKLKKAGHGMRNMVSRAEAAGGTLAVISRPGAGTTIQARLPLGS